MGRKIKGPEQRFFERIIKSSECWIWPPPLTSSGYGNFSVNGRPTLVHRFSYEIHIGDIPGGMVVMHKCDVRNCVNPDHLIIGTQTENMRDSIEKGRRYRLGKTDNGDVIGFSRYTKPVICKYGHDITKDENVYCWNGFKRCKICAKIYMKQHKDRKNKEL